MKKISDIPKRERPREKLQERGAAALSDLELMAVLVGKGTKRCDVMSVAERILKTLDASQGKSSMEELQKIEGVGPAKAMLIDAAIEFARRRIRPEGLKISLWMKITPSSRGHPMPSTRQRPRTPTGFIMKSTESDVFFLELLTPTALAPRCVTASIP